MLILSHFGLIYGLSACTNPRMQSYSWCPEISCYAEFTIIVLISSCDMVLNSRENAGMSSSIIAGSK